MAVLRFESQFAEPLRCWITQAPTRWPGPEGWWLDLAREELAGRSLRAAEPAMLPVSGADLSHIDDVAYLPPAVGVANWWRLEVRELLEKRGLEPIDQVLVGEPVEAGAGVSVVDLTPALLPARLDGLEAVPAGVHCCWPLIAGLTDRQEIWGRALALLAQAGVVSVQPVVPSLSPSQKRKLGDLTDRRGYQELFHGAAPDIRAFARAVSEHGLQCFLRRPRCGRAGRALENRRIAERLYLVAELLQRTGGSVDESLSFYRAARWVDEQSLDVTDLVRTGNLAVVPWLTTGCRCELENFVADQQSDFFDALQAEFQGESLRPAQA